jgi:DNA polymerase I-like protein with 3'-5' exonuclease and polymerase domains
MYVEHPQLVDLEDLHVVNHRVGLLKGFLRDMDANNYLSAQISGLTNTLRFQHKTIVNLPQMPKKYWKEVRECLIAPSPQWELCGADMSSLENNTKLHYCYYFDEAYVREVMSPGFDAHLDVAILAGYLTKEQAEAHKLWDKTKGKEGVSSKAIRLKAKKGNFAAVYGAGANKLAITLNIPLKEAKIFHTAYWLRNKAVKLVADSCTTKVVDGQKWLFNPVSQFWYSLRAEKDRFSTLNQSTGVYCFDTWVRHIRKMGWKICGQFHDEIIIPIERGRRDALIKDLDTAIENTNKDLGLNVILSISKDFGENYSLIH